MRQFKKNWKCDLEAALNEIEVRCLSFIYLFLGEGWWQEYWSELPLMLTF